MLLSSINLEYHEPSKAFRSAPPSIGSDWELETIKKFAVKQQQPPKMPMNEKTPTPHHRRNGCLPSFCSLFSKQNPLPNSRIFSYLLGSLSDFNLFGTLFRPCLCLSTSVCMKSNKKSKTLQLGIAINLLTFSYSHASLDKQKSEVK